MQVRPPMATVGGRMLILITRTAIITTRVTWRSAAPGAEVVEATEDPPGPPP